MLKIKTNLKIFPIIFGALLLSLVLPQLIFSDSGITTHPFSATYRITFDGGWTAADHPGVALHPNAHFSPLIGAIHGSNVKFWEPGQSPSAGIERMAELGLTDELTNEVNTAIGNGTALSVVSRTGNIDNVASVDIPSVTVNKNFPLVSLVTMVAPSHDWFIGVRDLSMLDGNGKWQDTITLDLFPYDAGTEEGIDFALDPSVDSTPRGPIFSIRGVAPFNSNPLASITFTRINYPDIHISKSVQPNTNVAHQGNVTFTLVLSNSGDLAASGTVLTDTLPADTVFSSWINQNGANHNNGTITWTGNVPTGGTPVTVSFVATYNGTAYDQTITNTAQFSHSSGNTGQASASFTIQSAPTPAIAVSKTANVAEAAVGDTITYTYRITNTGQVALNSITATDNKLGVVTVNPTSLSIGQVATGAATYTVVAGDLPGPLVNTVTVSGTPPSGPTVSAMAQATVNLVEAFAVNPAVPQTISNTTGDIKIEIPSSTLPPNAATLKFTNLGTTASTNTTTGLPNNAAFGLVFNLDLLDGSNGQINNPTFSSPLIVTATYNQATIDAQGIDENKLQVYFFNTSSNQWVALEIVSRDTTKNMITFKVNHFTEFALAASSQTKLYLPIVVKN